MTLPLQVVGKMDRTNRFVNRGRGPEPASGTPLIFPPWRDDGPRRRGPRHRRGCETALASRSKNDSFPSESRAPGGSRVSIPVSAPRPVRRRCACVVAPPCRVPATACRSRPVLQARRHVARDTERRGAGSGEVPSGVADGAAILFRIGGLGAGRVGTLARVWRRGPGPRVRRPARTSHRGVWRDLERIPAMGGGSGPRSARSGRDRGRRGRRFMTRAVRGLPSGDR